MKQAHIGIPQENIKKIVKLLENIFADENVLYTKLKNFHWNVVEHNFRDYHKFLDELAATSLVKIDEIAERVRTLGSFIPASMDFFLKNAQLKESHALKKSGNDMMKELLDDYETQIRDIRKAIEKIEALDDAGTTDFLTQIMEEKEKQAWMIRSTIV